MSTEVLTRTAIDLSMLYQAIWHDVKNVDKYLPVSDEHVVSDLKKYLQIVSRQLHKGCKDNKPRLDRLANDSCMSALNKFFSLYDNHHVVNNLPAEVCEHADHLRDRLGMLKAYKQDPKTVDIIKKRYVVKCWDKNDIGTFVLGNKLGCCLATDGSRFEAIIQRRMDMAMLMHVVMDEELNEPVAGNWLYFGCDINNPDDIYVVANFYEIRSGIGDKVEVRDQLIQKLTEYTAEFAKKIGAKGYLMAPLTYGLIPDFKDQYELKSIKVEKVGGYFNPVTLQTNDGNNEQEEQRYYLNSTGIDKFYDYDKPKLAVRVDPKSSLFTQKSVKPEVQSSLETKPRFNV